MTAADRVLVIADDLSGAAEIAGIAFAHGLTAEVQRQFDPATDAQVVAIDTNSRDLSAAMAAKRVRQVAEQIAAMKPAWVYKKVDSILRGNPRAEIEALMQATGQPRTLLAPANPTRGRLIVDGQYQIDGVPLDQTQFSRDAVHPRNSADVKRLLGAIGDFPIHSIGAADAQPLGCGIIVPDIQTPADLNRIAGFAAADTLMAGAADFFTALIWGRCEPSPAAPFAPLVLVPPALLICGSHATWSVRRQQCADAGVPIVEIESGFSTGPTFFGALLLGVGATELAVAQTTLLSFLSHLASALVKGSGVQTILMEGGATAAAVVECLGWHRFIVEAAAPAGVGVLRPLTAGAPRLLIKPGSYPWPAAIWQAFLACRHG